MAEPSLPDRWRAARAPRECGLLMWDHHSRAQFSHLPREAAVAPSWATCTRAPVLELDAEGDGGQVAAGAVATWARTAAPMSPWLPVTLCWPSTARQTKAGLAVPAVGREGDDDDRDWRPGQRGRDPPNTDVRRPGDGAAGPAWGGTVRHRLR